MEQSQLVHEDHTCPICLTVYLNPIKISKCKHVFCRHCLQDASQLGGNKKCPLCRYKFQEIQLSKEQELWDKVQLMYPNLIAQKKKSIIERKVLRLNIGNRTLQLNTTQDNKYEWTIFVQTQNGQKPLSYYAKKVIIKLHPTFRPNTIQFDPSKKTVQLTRIGWGTFRIQIIVVWKDNFVQKQTQFFHDLQFMPMKSNIVACHLHEKANK